MACGQTVRDGELGIAPIEELKMLRYNQKDTAELKRAVSCELSLTADIKPSSKAGLYVRMNRDMSGYTHSEEGRMGKMLLYRKGNNDTIKKNVRQVLFVDRDTLIHELEVFAEEIRVETLKEFLTRGFGHVGGAMSVIESLAVLYGYAMKIDPENPKMRERDWPCHVERTCGALALCDARAQGIFSDVRTLSTLNQPGTNLPSHCDKNKTVGIDMTTRLAWTGDVDGDRRGAGKPLR